MSNYSAEWLVNNHLIYAIIYDIDNDGIVSLIDEMNQMVSSSNLPLVHVILDLNQISKYPTNINEILPRLRTLFTNPRLGWYFHLTDNPMVGFLAQVASSAYRLRSRSYKTKDQALAFLKEQDSSLPDIQ